VLCASRRRVHRGDNLPVNLDNLFWIGNARRCDMRLCAVVDAEPRDVDI